MAENEAPGTGETAPPAERARDTNRQIAEDLLVRLRTTHGREASTRDVTDAIVAMGYALLAIERRMSEHRESLEKLRKQLDGPE